MLTPSQTTLPVPALIRVADDPEHPPTGGSAHVRLCRRPRSGRAAPGWYAVITLGFLTPVDPDDLLAGADEYLIDDEHGPIGVVDEIRPGEGTIVVACGWFGRRRLTVRFDDVDEILPAEQRLVLRPGVSASLRRERPSNSRVRRLARRLGELHPGRTRRPLATARPAR